MHIDIITAVTFLTAFVAQFSRLFVATRPFWSKLPAWVQVALPPLLPAVAALGQGLTGVKSWTDLAVVFIGAAALAVPGLPSNRSAAKLEAGKEPTLSPSASDAAVAEQMIAKASVRPPPPVEDDDKVPTSMLPPALVLLIAIGFAAHSSGCISSPSAKSIADIAHELCAVAFGERHAALNPVDVAKQFCSTDEQLDPFIQQLVAAKSAAMNAPTEKKPTLTGCDAAVENSKRLGCVFEADDAGGWCASLKPAQVSCLVAAKSCLATRECTVAK